MKISAIITFIFLPCLIFGQVVENQLLRTEEIRIRDPYIYADSVKQNYYMYAQMDNLLGGRGNDKRPKAGASILLPTPTQVITSPG